MGECTVSVAMAAYNGQAYIKDQIQSILEQLTDADELVISLDPSTDRTLDVIASFYDARIHVYTGPGTGVLANFASAIQHCQKDIIFLSDQDDIWLPDKKKTVLQAFGPDVDVVMHDARIVDAHLKEMAPSFFVQRQCRLGLLHNVYKNSYMGCCMAFRKELKPYILPFPWNIPMHDQWIGLVAEKVGHVVLLDRVLLLYRRHEKNVSAMEHASWKQMLRWRLCLVRAICKVRK